MARIRLLPNEELSEAGAAAAQAMEAAGQDTSTLRGLAHAQEFFDSYFQFYGPAREGRSISAELIELVRLRIARHNDCFT
jgi:alkylhydroperoxidase family enzyme